MESMEDMGIMDIMKRGQFSYMENGKILKKLSHLISR